ncbi:MAG TPA: tRNA (adenosine(37)-N6)-dimethylallyltransferase MiaA [Trueperaceae bacterium]
MTRVPVLAGPTASGKSALALRLAEHWPVEIVSADAMMVYRGMDIGTAKPSVAERARVPHHLIDVVGPDEAFAVADFVRLAEAAIGDILLRGRLPLVVGGTGFYIRALSEGLAGVPAADPTVQAELWERYRAEGLEGLARELEAASPEDAVRAQRNPRRVVRALEILARTGRPPSSFKRSAPAFAYSKLVLSPDRGALGARIGARTEAMFAAGLVGEVRALLARYPEPPTAMQAIGYKEVVGFLEGRGSYEEAMAAVSLATVQYARRQRTWFRKEPGARLLPALGEEALAEARAWLEGLAAG